MTESHFIKQSYCSTLVPQKLEILSGEKTYFDSYIQGKWYYFAFLPELGKTPEKWEK
jgi:hypothetical protein